MKKTPDNLESLFHQSFNDLDQINREDDWNVPSDDVWNHIERDLHPDKRRRSRFFYSSWVAVAASILLVISSYLYQEEQSFGGFLEQIALNEKVTSPEEKEKAIKNTNVNKF